MASKQETTTSIMSQIMNILEEEEKELFLSFNKKSVKEFSESLETNNELLKLGLIIKKILNYFLSKKDDANEDITQFTETIIQKYNSIIALPFRTAAAQQLISPAAIRNLPGFTPNSTPQGPQGTPYLQSPSAAASAAAAPLSSARELFRESEEKTGGKKRKRRRTKKRKSKKKRKRKSKRRKRKSRKRRKRTKRSRRS